MVLWYVLFLQAVFSYTYPSYVPSEVRLSCNSDNISLLNAETCLFYRYGKLEWIKYIWALGLLAAGQSSTMTVCVCVCVCTYMCLYACVCMHVHCMIVYVWGCVLCAAARVNLLTHTC